MGEAIFKFDLQDEMLEEQRKNVQEMINNLNVDHK